MICGVLITGNSNYVVGITKETRQHFSRMFVTLKKSNELFYPTYNGMTASVGFALLILVVLNAR